jgi:hypothetical protein
MLQKYLFRDHRLPLDNPEIPLKSGVAWVILPGVKTTPPPALKEAIIRPEFLLFLTGKVYISKLSTAS